MSQAQIHRLTRLLRRYTKLAQLRMRKRLSGGECFVDYGWMKLLFSDDGDLQEVFYHQNQRDWYRNDMAVLADLCAPGDTVVDVGANLGFVTAMLASLVGNAGTVIALEPSPSTYRKLVKTVAANDLSQVLPLNIGAGEKRATLELVDVSRESGNRTLVPNAPHAAARSERVDVIPLDELPELRDRRVALLKIDTEGFEAQVLRGAQALLTRDKPVIYVELGGGASYQPSTQAALDILGSHGYDTGHVAHSDWSQVGNGTNFVFRAA